MLVRDPVGLSVAVLAWGSLLWDPRNLRIATPWEIADFTLPLEFSRVSSGNRLTLVIDKDGQECPVYFALSSFRDLVDARENLMEREGAQDHPENVQVVTSDEAASDESYRERIRRWTKRRGLQATIWSAFKPNFNIRSEALLGARTPFNVANGRRFLAALKASDACQFKEARRYIVNAPVVVRTALRTDLEDNGWP